MSFLCYEHTKSVRQVEQRSSRHWIMGLQHFCQHLPVKSWIVRDGEELGILHADLRIASAVHEAGSRAGSRAEACLLGPGFRLSTAVLQHADPAWGREGPWWAGSFCRSPPSSLSRLMSLHKMSEGWRAVPRCWLPTSVGRGGAALLGDERAAEGQRWVPSCLQDP